MTFRSISKTGSFDSIGSRRVPSPVGCDAALRDSAELRHRVDAGVRRISARLPKVRVPEEISIQTADRACSVLRPPLRGDSAVPSRLPIPAVSPAHPSDHPRPDAPDPSPRSLKPHGVCEAFCRGCRGFSRPAPARHPPRHPPDPSSHRPIDPSTHRPIDPSTRRAIDPSSRRAVEPSSRRAIEPSTHRPIDPSTHRAIDLSTHRAIEPSSHRAVEPSSRRHLPIPDRSPSPPAPPPPLAQPRAPRKLSGVRVEARAEDGFARPLATSLKNR